MYLDPGFGGMLIQFIVGFVAVAGGVLFSFRMKILKLYYKIKNRNKPKSSKPTAQNADGDIIDMLKDETK